MKKKNVFTKPIDKAEALNYLNDFTFPDDIDIVEEKTTKKSKDKYPFRRPCSIYEITESIDQKTDEVMKLLKWLNLHKKYAILDNVIFRITEITNRQLRKTK